MLTTPVIGQNGIIDSTPPQVRAALYESQAEIEQQRKVLTARVFNEGKFLVKLTQRLKEFLGANDDFSITLDLINIVNRAVSERLKVDRFEAKSQGKESAAALNEWAMAVWDTNSRMPAKEPEMWEDAVSDGEHFLVVYRDVESNRTRIVPHPRYVGPQVCVEGRNGDGDGIRMHYENEKTNDKPLYASKRWTEHYFDERGAPKAQQQLNLYFPDRIEKYVLGGTGWRMLEGGLEWWTHDGTERGEPLGIPIMHVRNPKRRPEAERAWGMQKAVAKLLIDLLESSDRTAFQIFITYGWKMEDEKGQPLTMAPGQNIGTLAPPPEASTQIVDGADLSPYLETIDKVIIWMAGVTDTPASRFVMSGSVRAEGTLQEEKETLITKVGNRADSYSTPVRDALRQAWRQERAFGDGGKLGENEPEFDVIFKAFRETSVEEKQLEAAAMRDSGYPDEEIWRKVWGEDEQSIKRLKSLTQGDGFPDLSGGDRATQPATADNQAQKTDLLAAQ